MNVKDCYLHSVFEMTSWRLASHGGIPSPTNFLRLAISHNIMLIYTYCHGFSRQYSSNALPPSFNAVSILSKLKMFQKAAFSPVCIIRSRGDSKSLSANFKETDLTSKAASSDTCKLLWRKRTGKTRPAVKNSWTGRRGLLRTVIVPMAPTPLRSAFWCVARVFRV